MLHDRVAIRSMPFKAGPRRLSDRGPGHALPVGWPVILQKLAPDVGAGIGAADDRIDNARGAIDAVERRMKALLFGLPRGDSSRVFVGHPSCVDAVHVN